MQMTKCHPYAIHRRMMKKVNQVKTSLRIDADLHAWLNKQESLTAAVNEAIKRYKAELESEDYRRGFMDGYEARKKENDS